MLLIYWKCKGCEDGRRETILWLLEDQTLKRSTIFQKDNTLKKILNIHAPNVVLFTNLTIRAINLQHFSLFVQVFKLRIHIY